MNYRTDLALERHSLCGKNVPDGVDFNEQTKGEVKITRIKIVSPEGEKALCKPCGNYITLQIPKPAPIPTESQEEIECVANEIAPFIDENDSVLIIGLGNKNITPDAIGPKTVEYTLTTRHITGQMPDFNFRSVAALATGVMGQTGIETLEIVKSICDKIRPDKVIVVDALAAMTAERLCKTIQICDSGISPGSGVGNRRAELSQATLGVPTIAIGVPTVVDALSIAYDMVDDKGEQYIDKQKLGGLMVTDREIDALVTSISRVLALAIGRALQPQLSVPDLYFLSV